MKKIFFLILMTLLSSCDEEDDEFIPYPGGKSCCQQVAKILE